MTAQGQVLQALAADLSLADMLDAFARGLPVVAMRRATAALPIDAACLCVPDHDPRALAEAADRLLADHTLADRLRSAAFAYLDQHHSAAAFDAAMERLLGGAGRVGDSVGVVGPDQLRPQAV